MSQKIPLTTVANALLDLLGRSAHIGKSRVTSSVYGSLVPTFLSGRGSSIEPLRTSFCLFRHSVS